MTRILIFGNSGSGKSTLARSLSENAGLAHLDLDSIAWLPDTTPVRTPLDQCGEQIRQFTSSHDSWVIEGCYADLLLLAAETAIEIIFLNLSTGDCVANAKNRLWEPHKYATRELQDANLEMLVDWIRSYDNRDDDCSRQAHEAFFEQFDGRKTMRRQNGDANAQSTIS